MLMVRSGTDVGCGGAIMEPMEPSHLMAADSERVGQGSPVYLTSLSLTQGSARKMAKRNPGKQPTFCREEDSTRHLRKSLIEYPAPPSTKLHDNLAKSVTEIARLDM